jgi:hypothetical protein
MRPISHDDSLRVPEHLEDGPVFLEQTECEDGSSPEAIQDCHYRIRNNALKIFFRLAGPIAFCHDINGLFKGLKQEHNPPDWRLFIDSS